MRRVADDDVVTNRAKDMFIEQLQEERLLFAEERKDYIRQLTSISRRVGEMETSLKQIGSPDKPDLVNGLSSTT